MRRPEPESQQSRALIDYDALRLHPPVKRADRVNVGGVDLRAVTEAPGGLFDMGWGQSDIDGRRKTGGRSR